MRSGASLRSRWGAVATRAAALWETDAMTTSPASSYPAVSVRGEIKLGQFLKLTNLVEDGSEARVAVQSGDVLVNGEVETRRGHHLADGDVVEVELPSGADGAVVALID